MAVSGKLTVPPFSLRDMGSGRATQGTSGRRLRSVQCAWRCVYVAVLLFSGVASVKGDAASSSVAEVAYSEPQLNQSYRSSAEFDPQGMEHLYYVTNLFLDLIQRDDTAALDKEQLEKAEKDGNLIETLVQLSLYDWRGLVHHHIGYAVLAGCGIVVALLLPLVGLAVCCCRCAGRCGGRSQTHDKKRDHCRRWCHSITLSCLVILILFGVVASFVVNEYAEQGITEVPPRLHVAVDDSELYVLNTEQEVNHLLKDNYVELTDVLDQSLAECGDLIGRQLAVISEAVAVDNLTAIAESLADIQRDLTRIGSQTELLQNKADQLQVGLQDARAELSVLLRSCSSRRCRQLASRYNFTRLTVNNRFKQLPDVSQTESEIASLIESGVVAEVRGGQLALRQLSERIQAQVASVLPAVRQSISDAGIQLQQVAENITDALSQVRLKPAHSLIDQGNSYLQQYGTFRYYIFVIISGLVSVIVFCMVIGLFCGLCGRRPHNVYGDDTCNKGTGANFLLSGTFLYFLLGWLLLLLVTCMFVLGGLTQLYLCDGLANPAEPGSGLPLLEAVYPLERLSPALQNSGGVADVVGRCHRNESIYTVLRLEPLLNVSEVAGYWHSRGLHRQLDSLRRQITVGTSVTLLTARGRDQLSLLSKSSLALVDYEAFTEALEGDITSVDLDALGNELEAVAHELPGSQRSVATKLRNQAIILKAQQRVVGGMEDIVQDIRKLASSLQRHVRFGDSIITEAVGRLTERAEQAQEYLNDLGPQQLAQLAEQFTVEFDARLDTYSFRVESVFRQSLGRCAPISAVYNATGVTLCSNVIYPFNAFWAAVGWCLLLFVPCVIISLALTPLYRKAEPFSEGLIDTDCLYDAYGDNDDIPLASMRGGGGGERRRGRSNDLSRSAGGGYSPESPSYSAIPPRGHLFQPVGASGSQHEDDTEPKAPPIWDISLGGGPPGYRESPPATREHPPPYSPSEAPMLGHG